MLDENVLAAAPSCSVVAAAGCGKTELIAKAVAVAPSTARFLVLTHTHAGVRALRQRFKKLGIRSSRARIDTIAGWSLDYALSYPCTTGCKNPMPETDEDWDAVYGGAAGLLKLPAIQRVVRATYSAVYIDEYQDCTPIQHAIAVAMSKILPCRVLGDPLQRIFNFAGATLSWIGDVERCFPPLGELEEPWRWKGRNAALGLWLTQIRKRLIAGLPVDLAANQIRWMKSDPKSQGKVAMELLESEGRVVAIRKLKAGANKFASARKGYFSVEEVRCEDLLKFAHLMDSLSGPARALAVVKFAAAAVTKVSTYLKKETDQLARGEAITVRATQGEERRQVIEALQVICGSDDLAHVSAALRSIMLIPKARMYRKDLLWATKDALTAKATGEYGSFHEAAWKSRNRSRHFDKRLPPRMVSRTLLIKGLEFEHAFVVDADEFTGDDAAQHFYVAISRGSTSLTVMSSVSTIQFPVPRL